MNVAQPSLVTQRDASRPAMDPAYFAIEMGSAGFENDRVSSAHERARPDDGLSVQLLQPGLRYLKEIVNVSQRRVRMIIVVH